MFLRQKEAGTYLSVTATKGETILSPALVKASIKKMERVKESVRDAIVCTLFQAWGAVPACHHHIALAYTPPPPQQAHCSQETEALKLENHSQRK